MPIRIAVDAMGGDHAPSVIIDGAVRAVQECGTDVELYLIGVEDLIRSELSASGGGISLPDSIHIVDAPDVIGMDEAPTSAIKNKPRSSIHLGLGMCREGKTDAFVSAGNTGAVMAGSLFLLGRLPEVSRPTVIGHYPTLKGTCVLLDVGTNVDCKPEHLVQFAHMGSIYAERVLGLAHPSVALMNIGEEPGKGNELAKAAFEKLQGATGIHFKGNIEGRDLLSHAADVVVCDGFVGNILLKFGESVASALPRMIAAEMMRLGMDEQEQKTVAKALSGVKARFDYEEYGGAPLLGVAGTVVIGHGGSSAYAVKNMILAAQKMVHGSVKDSIAAALSE